MSRYVVVSAWPAESACVVTDEDGNVKIFDDEPSAKAEAAECQSGVVVPVQ